MKNLAANKGFIWFLFALSVLRLFPTLVIYDGQGIFGQAPVIQSAPAFLLLFFILQMVGILTLAILKNDSPKRETILYAVIGSNVLVLIGSIFYSFNYGNVILSIVYNILFLIIGFVFTIAVSHGYDLVYLITSSVINICLVFYLIALNKSKTNASTNEELNIDGQFSDKYKEVNASLGNIKEVWILAIPGSPDVKLATSELPIWAKKGFIKNNTLLTEIATNRVYPASQIPGVFSNRTYLMASILSFFLGVLGIDRLYLGYVGTGLLKMFTLGGFGIWALIDLIRILTRNLPDSDGLYLS
jgi:hypothetical protein